MSEHLDHVIRVYKGKRSMVKIPHTRNGIPVMYKPKGQTRPDLNSIGVKRTTRRGTLYQLRDRKLL